MVIMLAMIVGPILVILGCCIACIYVWKCVKEDNYNYYHQRYSVHSHKLEQTNPTLNNNDNRELENIIIK